MQCDKTYITEIGTKKRYFDTIYKKNGRIIHHTIHIVKW